MKIAQVAPVWESIPPQRYGRTERAISYLTEALVRRGHEVTLFAAGDSSTSATLHAICPSSLRANHLLFPDAVVSLLLERAFGTHAGSFDLIHSHIELLGFPLARRCPTPVLTTLHSRLDLPELVPAFQQFCELPLVSVSDAQRHPMPLGNWQATIHYGLPRDLYSMHARPGTYLAFLGRISPESGLEQAIQLAKRTDMPIRIAAKVNPADRDYFQQIAPLLEHPLVEYVGEITDEEKNDFLGEAYALTCPYEGPEPFGLVMIEALACGTPVLAYRRGTALEIVDDGYTGYLCDTLSEMQKAIMCASTLDRHRCRAVFEKRFTAERMADNYLALYQLLALKQEDQLVTQSSFPINHAVAISDV